MPNLQQSFRKHPGCRERHLRRKLSNPLFDPAERDTTPEELDAEQRRDDDELSAFLEAVKTLVARVGALSPDSDTGEVVQLKQRADSYYEQCLGLPGDQRRVKAALIKLITELTRLNMQTLSDTRSLVALQEEQVRRLAHFTRLEFPVTGDICREQSPVADGDLVPTLLSEPADALDAALGLFDAERVNAIRDEARALITARRDEGHDMSRAEESLAVIARHAGS
ncbi:MAG: hypothetical protein U5R46_14150 [Gammaproteobacteria bacterium]|nr:hypothetical protein [Gammaproteobacteria bacterium]